MKFELLSSETERLAHAHIIESLDDQQGIAAALKFAALMLCKTATLNATEPCGHCHSCQLFVAENHPDLLSIGQEGNSVGVEEVRSISSFLSKTAHIAAHQVVLIYNADRMTESAANAVLKTLEEPTANSYLLLLSENRNNQAATIRSRCQVWPIDGNPDFDNSNIPNYVIGFAAGANGKLESWATSDSIVHFEAVYANFIQWLKHQVSATELLSKTKEHEALPAFLLYIIERRVRQLILKGQEDKGVKAEIALNTFMKTRQEFRNQGEQVAMIALLLELELFIR